MLGYHSDVFSNPGFKVRAPARGPRGQHASFSAAPDGAASVCLKLIEDPADGLEGGRAELSIPDLNVEVRSFGAWFEPRCIVGAGLLDQ